MRTENARQHHRGGEEDRLIDIDEQSHRLHGNIVQSNFHRVPGAGHMVHQTATSSVISAINQVSTDMSSERPGGRPRLIYRRTM